MTVAADLRASLLELVPDASRVATGESILRLHGEGLGYHESQLPDAVVFATSTAEVSAVLAFASRERIALVPFGAGTSLEGQTIPVRGGISLDLTRLDAIEIRPGDLQATVGAGVTRLALEQRAGEQGLWFPVDPGADASLGGMAATNASGTTTVRYGGMRQNVLELEVVLADGGVIRAGSRTVKSSAGYNLAQLFVGSEGTLGVITGLTVRLYGIPEHVVAVRAAFPDLDAACRCSTALVGAGVALTRVELLDGSTVAAINVFKGTSLPERPHLFVELAGSEAGVAGDLEATRELAADEGCESFDASTDPTERSRLWSARHDAFFAVNHAHPGKLHMPTDVCVPLSELPAAIRHARTAMEAAGFDTAIIGHVGDGNFHALLLFDPDSPDERARASAVNGAIVADALARGGTCSGEHGIGLGKVRYLEQEHGDLLPLMRGIKSLLDPGGILNPGKIFAAD
jgi:D-lactate dehydrogenase (cytochrome)